MRSFARLTRSLKKPHSSLLNEQNEKKHVETCDVGLTCDIIDESLYKPIIVAPLLVAFLLLPHLVVMVSLVMPH